LKSTINSVEGSLLSADTQTAILSCKLIYMQRTVNGPHQASRRYTRLVSAPVR